ncbi:ZIP family metal transporter [Patescibacteria group bacterium]|nr:ZIP family metal transporter [Patescibacteria group bacterium]
MIFLIACATAAATLLGGMFALRFRDKLHLILGFSAGALIGVAFFDLLPEAINLGSTQYGIPTVTATVALGFLVFMTLDRSVHLYAKDDEFDAHSHSHRGKLGAGSLSIHSFMDGLAIGLAFHVSAAIGWIVATAVLVHDFSDGINTVNLILKDHGTPRQAFQWLLTDAIAPVLGVLSTLFFTLPEASLGLVLALFCGFFLYIGASDLLPESYHQHQTHWATVMTALGMAVLYLAVHFASL